MSPTPARTAAVTRVPLLRLASLLCGVLAVCGLVAALALPGAARAASARSTTHVVRYDGWSARVPSSWPVFHLGPDSRTCVRFNRHAVYLGQPGAREQCPAHAVGRTESILVTPRSGTSGAAGSDALSGRAGASAALPTAGTAAQVTRHDVVVTATWSQDPGAVRAALGVRSVAAATRAWDRRAGAALRGDALAARAVRPEGLRSAPTGPAPDAVAHAASPGAVFTGLGFDACSAPSQSAMTAWSNSPFRAVGVYIGGTNMACNQSNLTATWVAAQAAAGWSLVPIYVGLQAPGNGCGCAAISETSAAAQGTAAAQSAIEEAQALGLGTGNPIYYDMENYTRTTTASATVLTFLGAWTAALHQAGYASGVYGSELSGIEDLVAEQGTGYLEPDDIWVANWNGAESTTDPKVPSTDWADNQRLHQYRGGHTDDYGGSSISIDSDYLDGATAAPGTGTGTVTTTIAAAPTVAVHPQPDGALEVSPSWTGETGVSRWQVVAGPSPSALTTIGTVSGAHPELLADDAYPYFQVEAYNAAGQELGVSGTVATPSHVAVFGRSAFVSARGPGGLPVECYAITGCRVSTTIVAGHTQLTRTGAERVPAGGGIVLFPLSSRAHELVQHAGSAGLPVTVTVRTTNGRVATQAMHLVRFTTSGRGPRRVVSTGSRLAILGVTDFVSHGWAGGILVACRQLAPCTATPAVRIGRTSVASAHAQTIGGGEIGYLSFTMTHAGHAQLMRASGNQLGVSVAVSGGGRGLAAPLSARALIAIDAF